MELNWMRTNKIPQDLRSFQQDEIRNSCLRLSHDLLRNYDEFAHKGTRGHAAILAGNRGMMGAAILSTQAAIRSGAGKVTAIVPEPMFALIHTTVPEALVCSQEEFQFKISSYSAIAAGPGLGNTESTIEWLKILFKFQKPLILDADALNATSSNKDLLSLIPKGSLLTPHQLEAERLVGSELSDYYLIKALYEICIRHNINILLKNHFSVLLTPSGEFYINGTGNSGMGKAGSGDVLTGLFAGLAAQGLSLSDSAILGACIHGLAGDLAKEEIGEDAMCATDQIMFLSKAFKMLRNWT